MIDNFPAFGVVVAFADWLAEHRTQPAAAPDVTAKDGLEAERIHAEGFRTKYEGQSTKDEWSDSRFGVAFEDSADEEERGEKAKRCEQLYRSGVPVEKRN